MPPKRKSPPTEGQLGPNKASKKTHLLEELVTSFRDLKSIEFEPFQLEQECPAKALLSSNFLIQLLPSDYFNLFFTPDLYKLIVRNTNKYVAIQRLNKVEKVQE